MHTMLEQFNISVGYSDHTLGIEVPIAAVALGAKVIEKHFTLDKSDTTIRDHALSLLPHEFKMLVELGTAMNKINEVLKNKN